MSNTSHLSRRTFGALAAAAPAALAQQQTGNAPNPNTAIQQERQMRRQRPPDVPPFDLPIEFKRADVALKVEPFPLKQVKVTGGIYKEAEEWNRGYLGRLSADRLLYNFRENAGLDTKGAKPLADMNAPRVSSWSIPMTTRAPPNSAVTSPVTLSPRSRKWPPAATPMPKPKAIT